MSTIGLGIVGCGSRVGDLAKDTVALGDKVKVVAVCDPRPRAIETARKYFDADIPIIEDYRKLVRRRDVQWVAVGSYNHVHRDHVVAALRAGKDVFCEKPMAINLKQCLDIGKAWKKSGRRLIIGFTLRYSSHYRKIKEIVDSGRIGKILSFEFNETLDPDHGGFIHGDWRRLTRLAGTHLLEKCCHDIDLVNWIVGALPARVASFGGTDFFKPENNYHTTRLKPKGDGTVPYQTWTHYNPDIVNPFMSDKDIVDNQVAIIEFANKVRATFHTNCNTSISERRMYILGTEGAIRSDVLNGSIWVKRIGYNEELVDESTAGKGGHGGGDEVLTRSWYDCMTSDKQPETSYYDGLKSCIASFAIDEAMAKGKVVDLAKMWAKADLPG